MIAKVKVNDLDIDELHIKYQVVRNKFVWEELYYLKNNTYYIIKGESTICSLNGVVYSSLKEFVNSLLSKVWDNVCWIDLTLSSKDRYPHFFIGYKTITPSKFIDNCKISFRKKHVDKIHIYLNFSDVSRYIALRFNTKWKIEIIKLDDLFASCIFGTCNTQGWGGFIEEKSMFYLPSIREQGCYYFTSTEEDIRKFKVNLIKEGFLNGNIRY